LEESYLKTILLQSITKFLGKRQRLLHINSFEDVIELIKKSKKIMVLTGAGVIKFYLL
jgi:NAD-dependent histone deacetylase SIR2